MSPARKQMRDGQSGQYVFDGNFDRLCRCGHTLGVHCAGGWDCLVGTGVRDDPRPDGPKCECQKFRPVKRRGA